MMMVHDDENNFKYEQQAKFKYFGIDFESQSTNCDRHEMHHSDSGPVNLFAYSIGFTDKKRKFFFRP